MSDSNLLLIGTGLALVLGGLLVIKSKTTYADKSPPPTNPSKTLPEATSATPSTPPPAAAPMVKKEQPLTIFFGSQTGTAEGYANALKTEAVSKGFEARVIDLEDWDADEFIVSTNGDGGGDPEEKMRCIFLIATYGEGEPTDNAHEFIKYIKSNEASDLLSAAPWEYTVFGLGNKQYEQYNATGKFLSQRLNKYCGKDNEIAGYGEGDDDVNLDDDYEGWKENVLWPGLMKRYRKDDKGSEGGEKRVRSPSTTTPPKPNKVHLVSVVNGSLAHVIPSDLNINNTTRHFFTAAASLPVSTNKELRNIAHVGENGSTKHIEVNIKNSHIESYNTADNAGVLSENNEDLVNLLGSALKFNLSDNVKLSSADSNTSKGYKHLFPTPCTISDILTKYTDITSTLRRSDLKVLSSFCTDEIDAQLLLRLSGKKGKEEYTDKIERAHVGFAQLCTKYCKSITFADVGELVQVTSRLQPRYYTISSSSLVHPDSIHMTVSVIDDGVCSPHMSASPTCRVFVRPSTFRLPSDTSTPIILIGPGTGIAPMRALLQERYHISGKSGGKNTLYFGCKHRDQDYIYRDELEGYAEKGVLTNLRLAFSRETSQKVYVQHLIASDLPNLITQIKEENAYVYVCGGTGMGRDVIEVLKGGLGDAYLKQMSGDGRLVQELWA